MSYTSVHVSPRSVLQTTCRVVYHWAQYFSELIRVISYGCCAVTRGSVCSESTLRDGNKLCCLTRSSAVTSFTRSDKGALSLSLSLFLGNFTNYMVYFRPRRSFVTPFTCHLLTSSGQHDTRCISIPPTYFISQPEAWTRQTGENISSTSPYAQSPHSAPITVCIEQCDLLATQHISNRATGQSPLTADKVSVRQ